jgi:hypothetical protein
VLFKQYVSEPGLSIPQMLDKHPEMTGYGHYYTEKTDTFESGYFGYHNDPTQYFESKYDKSDMCWQKRTRRPEKETWGDWY